MQWESKDIDPIVRYWLLLEELKRQKEKIFQSHELHRGVLHLTPSPEIPASERMPEVAPIR